MNHRQRTALTIAELLARRVPPVPWEEGDNTPWDEPEFSKRMLDEHLSQAHDLASRREPLIDAHVAFIQQHLQTRRRARILDFGCGPGLYLHRLARLGHQGHGIDFSPSSLGYAREVATRECLDCSFEQADLREASFGVELEHAALVENRNGRTVRDGLLDGVGVDVGAERHQRAPVFLVDGRAREAEEARIR